MMDTTAAELGNKPSSNQSFALLAMPVWVARLVAVVAAAVFVVARAWLGLELLLLPVVLLLGVSCAVVSVPCWGTPRWAIPTSVGTLVLVLLAGYASPFIATAVVWVVAAVGLLGMVFMVVRLAKSHASWSWLGTIVVALLLAWWLATYLYGYMYTPHISEELLAGTYTGDTIFHAGIANMLRTYGVPTSGLHFTPLLHYHVGAHWVAAQLAAALHVDVLMMYQMASTMLFIPLLVYFTLALYAIWVDKTQATPPPTQTKGMMGVGVALMALYFAISNGLPTMMTDDLLVDFFTLFRSESYLLSVVASLGLITWLVQQPFDKHGRPAWPTCAVAALFVPVIFMFKMTTGLMVMGGLGYVWLRTGGFKNLANVAIVGVGGVLCLAAYKWFSAGAYPMDRQAFAFLHTYVHPDFWLYFVPVHSAWVVLYAAVQVYRVAPVSVPDWAAKIAQGRFVLLETLLVMTAVSYVPMFTFVTDGGAGFYFTDVVKWLALPFVLATVAPPLAAWLTQHALTKQHRWRYSVGWLVVAVIVASNVGEVLAQTKRLFKSHGANVRAMRVLPPQAEKQAFYQQLQALNALPNKQQALVYIPKANHFFWQEWLENRRDGAKRACKYAPFSVPAITGIAMVHGLPSQHTCPHLTGYGLKSYFDHYEDADVTRFEADPCAVITQRGFTTLHRFDDGMTVTTVECPL